ncbi:MAG: GNAT family N-acetyltransferase [Pseudobdellovibrionaceae bacterium]
MQNSSSERKVFLDNYEESDRIHFSNLLSDPETMKFTDGPKSSEAIEKLFSKFLNREHLPQDLVFAARNENNEYVGHAALFKSDVCNDNEREILFYILKSYWGKGYATEVGQQLLKMAFECQSYEAVVATLDTDHFASIKVCEKIGMNQKKVSSDEFGSFLIFEVTKVI